MIIPKRQGKLLISAIFLISLCSGLDSDGAQRPTETQGQAERKMERVLIETHKPYDRVIAAVQSRGGRVTRQYKYVDALAAELPIHELEALRSQIGESRMSKDVVVPGPRSVTAHSRPAGGLQIGPVVVDEAASADSLSSFGLPFYAATNPEAYSINNAGTRVDKVHARGFTGWGVTVAVIDSGIRPDFAALESDQSVIGGEDFVGDGLGYSNVLNDPHGTFVAGLISGNALFRVEGPLNAAIRAYAPNVLDSSGRLAILGSAPSAKIYALRVFGPNAGAGASISVILDAIQRVIDLRRDYDRGQGGMKIEVCNISFGVMTLAAGRSLLERAIDAMLDAGIVPVASGGNAGPASLTASSPGSSMSAVTVGAASQAINERIGMELAAGEGAGGQLRPFSPTQTAWFSSRGPNADGRPDPDVLASGVFNISQAYCADGSSRSCPRDISMASGTSYAAPIVSGIAAILRQAFPWASATQIRNAIALTGRASQLGDGSSAVDRGTGLADALGAFHLLAAGRAPDSLSKPERPGEDVRRNVEASGLVVHSGTVSKTINDLKPGERADLLYDVPAGTSQVIVAVTEVTASKPPSRQNPIYGDGLFVTVHTAKTSSVGELGDYVAQEFPRGDYALTVDDPDVGIMRITVSGDTVNAGKVSATVRIAAVKEALPKVTAKGIVRDQKTVALPLFIPGRVEVVEFVLSWDDDWSHYPTSDIDLILIPPGGDPITKGITLAGPERVRLERPQPGLWEVQIDGFNIPASSDRFKLRVLIDREIVREVVAEVVR